MAENNEISHAHMPLTYYVTMAETDGLKQPAYREGICVKSNAFHV